MNPPNITEKVYNAAANSYLLNDIKEEEIHKLDKSTLYIQKYKRIENIITSSNINDIDTFVLEEFKNRGLEIWLLVELSILGKAHEIFRNKVDKLQPWVYDEGRVKFYYPEIA